MILVNAPLSAEHQIYAVYSDGDQQMGNLFIDLVIGCGAAFMIVIGFVSIEDALKHRGSRP